MISDPLAFEQQSSNVADFGKVLLGKQCKKIYIENMTRCQENDSLMLGENCKAKDLKLQIPSFSWKGFDVIVPVIAMLNFLYREEEEKKS